MTTPATHALRYRIWAYAAPREWNVTNAEIAEALGESVHRVKRVTTSAGWAQRLRAARTGGGHEGLFGTKVASDYAAAAIRQQLQELPE
jgi:hypothetical protein